MEDEQKLKDTRQNGEMRRSAACKHFILSRKVGLGLLCVVVKVLATRGLGVPVDNSTGREADRHRAILIYATKVSSTLIFLYKT